MKTCEVKECNNIVPFGKRVCSKRCAGKLGAGKRKIIRREKEAKIHPSGYLYYTRSMLTDEEKELFTDKKQRTILVHRLVMAKFIGEPLPEKCVIRHLNGDKTDNRIINLQMGNHKENSIEHHDAVVDMMKWRRLAVNMLCIYSKAVTP